MTEIILIVILFILSLVVLGLALTLRRFEHDIRMAMQEAEDIREAFEERRRNDNITMNEERYEHAETVAQLRRELKDSYSSLELALSAKPTIQKRKR